MTDRVVVITGANNGIGLALARALRSDGFRVAALDLSGENLEGIDFYRCDVTDVEQVRAAIGGVVAAWGQIDILVNNACVAVFAPFEIKRVEDTRWKVEVNYVGYLHLITAVLPHMRSRGGGIIHSVGSTVGLSGFDGVSGYASTKGAIGALTRTLAIELARYGIVVNMVYPPLTRTASATPLGIPEKFMADPTVVGRKLAQKVVSRRAVITPGIPERMGVVMTRFMPATMGRFLSSRAASARRRRRRRGEDACPGHEVDGSGRCRLLGRMVGPPGARRAPRSSPAIGISRGPAGTGARGRSGGRSQSSEISRVLGRDDLDDRVEAGGRISRVTRAGRWSAAAASRRIRARGSRCRVATAAIRSSRAA